MGLRVAAERILVFCGHHSCRRLDEALLEMRSLLLQLLIGLFSLLATPREQISKTHSHLNPCESRAINCKIVLTYDSLPRETVDTTEQALAVVSVTDGSSLQLVILVVPQLTAMPADPPSLSVLWASPPLCDSRLLSHFKCISPKQ